MSESTSRRGPSSGRRAGPKSGCLIAGTRREGICARCRWDICLRPLPHGELSKGLALSALPADVVSVRMFVLGLDDEVGGFADVAQGVLHLLLGVLVELLGLGELSYCQRPTILEVAGKHVNLRPAAQCRRPCRRDSVASSPRSSARAGIRRITGRGHLAQERTQRVSIVVPRTSSPPRSYRWRSCTCLPRRQHLP